MAKYRILSLIRQMKVAFHSRLLTERGSEGAMLDYARLNQSVLGHESVLCLPESPGIRQNPILEKWRKEFRVILYQSKHEFGRKLSREGVGVIYLTKPGPWDGFLIPGIRNCVHAQFLCDEFHGEAYAYLSPWMSQVMTGKRDSYVPFFVPKLVSQENLRSRLRIPDGAKVFGRHGGWDTFNIPFVRQTVAAHARHHPEDHFVFLNTAPIAGTQELPNVHYLPATLEEREKAKFLATCDAMLHGRWHGETFGLAVGEFAVLGKKVLTYGNSRERAHLEMLGTQAGIYTDRRSLEQHLRDFQPGPVHGTEYETYADAHAVMGRFRACFLD